MLSYEFIRNNNLANWFVINLRFIIGFGFVPSGLRKIIGEPFANPGMPGVFFEYLDALHGTGFYYEMIGWAQVMAGILLITQRFATLGAMIFLPIIFNIMVLTLCTIGSLTPVIATLMCIGIFFLVFWDYYKWINILSSDNILISIPPRNNYPSASKFWIRTGLFTLLFPILILPIKYLFQNSEEVYINITTLFLGVPVLILFIANLIFIVKTRFLKNLE